MLAPKSRMSRLYAAAGQAVGRAQRGLACLEDVGGVGRGGRACRTHTREECSVHLAGSGRQGECDVGRARVSRDAPGTPPSSRTCTHTHPPSPCLLPPARPPSVQDYRPGMLFSDLEVDVPRRKHFADAAREAPARGGLGAPGAAPLDDGSAPGACAGPAVAVVAAAWARACWGYGVPGGWGSVWLRLPGCQRAVSNYGLPGH